MNTEKIMRLIISFLLIIFLLAGCASKVTEETINYYNQYKNKICIGDSMVLGLKDNGDVVAVSDEKNYQEDLTEYVEKEWTNIVEICSGYYYTVGLKADGTIVGVHFGHNNVISPGKTYTYLYNGLWNSNKDEWNDIVDISVSNDGQIISGVKKDGTVVIHYVGGTLANLGEAKKWKDIKMISVSDEHAVGLKSDGTVVATGDNFHNECKVDGWKDVIEVYAENDYTIGLRSDGTLLVTGGGIGHKKKSLKKWKNIVDLATNYRSIIGLKSDGTIVMVDGYDDGWKNKVTSMKDIVSIDANSSCVVGLKADGTVVVEADDYYANERVVESWDLIK